MASRAKSALLAARSPAGCLSPRFSQAADDRHRHRAPRHGAAGRRAGVVRGWAGAPDDPDRRGATRGGALDDRLPLGPETEDPDPRRRADRLGLPRNRPRIVRGRGDERSPGGCTVSAIKARIGGSAGDGSRDRRIYGTCAAHPESLAGRTCPTTGCASTPIRFPSCATARSRCSSRSSTTSRRKGIISAVAFDESGPVGTPVPVLDLPHHLSYPFVFEEDGEVWMIPESCAAGTIDLYRATAFPGGWVHEARLVDGVVAERRDARAARWPLVAVRHGAGPWRVLFRRAASLVRVRFRGPWTPHMRRIPS